MERMEREELQLMCTLTEKELTVAEPRPLQPVGGRGELLLCHDEVAWLV